MKMEEMNVFKFGGASIRDANAVRNMVSILRDAGPDRKVIVVSAMHKTTNQLERVVEAFMNEGDWKSPLNEVFDAHVHVLQELLPDQENDASIALEKVRTYAFTFLNQDEGNDFNFIYDQIVALGEILSTKIIAGFLIAEGIDVVWADARKLIQTDNSYRDAKVDWESTTQRIQEHWQSNAPHSIITQGFIGGGEHQRMTTLGREGSDFSAAIFAYALNAKSVTIWKDVSGMLNADPKHFSNTTLLPNISYREAIELSYYGASVIHPKTIKPLENQNIPLYVKSFLAPSDPGSIINDNTSEDSKIPSYIFKTNQVLISISSRDFSFIVEEHISDIFASFAKHKLKIQTMQNSAISFSVSVSDDRAQIEALIQDLQKDYQVLYNDGLELLTIRHYNEKIVGELIKGKEVLLQQKTRHTMRILMRA
ncbi:MAG: aspartate kinase [Cryomorphaceae bacterium]